MATVPRGCCGGENSGPPKILDSFNVSECAALCCSDPMCGVAVLTRGQQGPGEFKCWLTHLTSPGGYEPPPPPGQQATTITLNRDHGDADAIIFGEGGWQSVQGSPVGSHFFIENVRELLDVEGEWFHDAKANVLYMWRNTSLEQSLPSAAYFGTLHESVIKIVGQGSHRPASRIRVSGLVVRHTTTDFLRPHEAPGGGDQSVHRGAAIFVQNAANITITNCRFDRVDGSGVFVSNWTRGVEVSYSEFSFTGSAAVCVVGTANLIDGTNGNFPRMTLIEKNWIHDGGVWSKNYLGGSIFLALQAESVVRGNVLYNTPRSGITFNDGFGGGDLVANNLIFNTNRETSDTGNIYTYNRLPFVTSVRNGIPSLLPATRNITRNWFIVNYGSIWGIDNDDGSSFYLNAFNVHLYGPAKHSTFVSGGHSKVNTGSLYLVERVCATGQGYNEAFSNNTCFIFSTQTPVIPSSCVCDPSHPTSTPTHPVPTPSRANNTYHLLDTTAMRIRCGSVLWNLSESQCRGVEVGSVVEGLDVGNIPDLILKTLGLPRL